MGATTYRVMSRFAAEGEPGTDALADMSKLVFSNTLSEPLAWANTQRTFDGRIQLLEYGPTILPGPPGVNAVNA
jgi:hypothetical protein